MLLHNFTGNRESRQGYFENSLRMKIAITSPFGWPYVRRGNRFAHELASYLAERGHQVHFISTKPGVISRKKLRGKVMEEYHRLFCHPLLSLLNIEMWETFAIGCLRSFMRVKYDIVQTFWPPDAFAASLNRSLRGVPFVLLMVDSNHFYRPTLLGKPMLKRALKNVSCLEVPSTYVNEELKSQLNLEGALIPMPVNLDEFTPDNNKKLNPPRILCTSSFHDFRKRVNLLVLAFDLLLMKVPNAILQLSGHGTRTQAANGILKQLKPETKRSIEILDVGKLEDMPKLYREASLTVLPSLQEAFGMVIIESLASGTPVVGARSGALPEVIDDPEIGVLFEEEGGPRELCKALINGLELASDSRTTMRCRKYAERYSWSELGPQFEALYNEVLEAHKNK
jgi:phosphatidylinositol alpha-mannosyltransferase